MDLARAVKDHKPLIAIVTAVGGLVISALTLDDQTLPNLIAAAERLSVLIARQGWWAKTALVILIVAACVSAAARMISAAALDAVKKLHVGAPLWVAARAQLSATPKAPHVGNTIDPSSPFNRPVRKVVSLYQTTE